MKAFTLSGDEKRIYFQNLNRMPAAEELIMVMKEMQQTFCMMGNTAEEYSIEEQLNNMFNTINSF